MEQPATQYAKNGDIHIAYQVLGEGPDIIYLPGWFSHADFIWEVPSAARFLQRLASFSRLIMIDRRAAGLSDRTETLGTLEEQMDDVFAVMDAVESDRAVMFGAHDGGMMAALFAASFPERTTALIVYAAAARVLKAPDYRWGVTEEQWQFYRDQADRLMMNDEVGLPHVARSLMNDERMQRWWARFNRAVVSPGAALAWLDQLARTDLRPVLPAIRVPTLVLRRENDPTRPAGAIQDVAGRIPGARFVELPGEDHLVFVGDVDAVVDEIQEFITGVRPAREPDRVLATVMFTDIVRSTESAARLGDQKWRQLLEVHDQTTRRALTEFRGREIKRTGDGFLATFDGPARAIRCALAIDDAVTKLGIEVRAGLHTGELELIDGDVGGLCVHIAYRVADLAGPREVVVSSTVKDLVAGSGINFADRGSRALKGVPGRWRIFSVQR